VLTRRQAALIAFAGVAAVVAGCGNSSSAQGFRRDANRLCGRYAPKLVVDNPFAPMAPSLSKGVKALERMHGEFGKLTPPPNDAERFREYLRFQTEAIRQVRRLQRFAALNEPKALAALPTDATLAEAMRIPAYRRYDRGMAALSRAYLASTRKGGRLAKELGFKACRSPSFF